MCVRAQVFAHLDPLDAQRREVAGQARGLVSAEGVAPRGLERGLEVFRQRPALLLPGGRSGARIPTPDARRLH